MSYNIIEKYSNSLGGGSGYNSRNNYAYQLTENKILVVYADSDESRYPLAKILVFSNGVLDYETVPVVVNTTNTNYMTSVKVRENQFLIYNGTGNLTSITVNPTTEIITVGSITSIDGGYASYSLLLFLSEGVILTVRYNRDSGVINFWKNTVSTNNVISSRKHSMSYSGISDSTPISGFVYNSTEALIQVSDDLFFINYSGSTPSLVKARTGLAPNSKIFLYNDKVISFGVDSNEFKLYYFSSSGLSVYEKTLFTDHETYDYQSFDMVHIQDNIFALVFHKRTGYDAYLRFLSFDDSLNCTIEDTLFIEDATREGYYGVNINLISPNKIFLSYTFNTSYGRHKIYEFTIPTGLNNIFIGDLNTSKLFVGESEVVKIYIGEDKIYEV